MSPYAIFRGEKVNLWHC